MAALTWVEPLSPGGDAASLPPLERQVLERVHEKIGESPALSGVLSFLFDATRDVYPCDRISVAFVDRSGRRLSTHWIKALYEPLHLRDGYTETLEGSSLARLFETGETRVIHDLDAYLEEHPESRSTRLLVDEGVRSSLAAPLFVAEGTRGVLFRSSREVDAYTRHHVRLHQEIAGRLAQAVDKAWRIEQLAEANRAYAEILGFVSHELRAPVAAMVRDAELMAGGYLGELSDKQLERVSAMAGEGRALLDMVRDYMELARVEGGAFERRLRDDVDPRREVIDPALALVASSARQRGIDIEAQLEEAPEVIRADPDLLRIALVNLLGNAVKYGREGGRVALSVRQEEDKVAFEVWNEGPGFSADDSEKLFKRFSRLAKPELKERPGTGLGLYTAWRIVRAHGGRIDADSEEGTWARFTISIPASS